jgi:hypothetical protein
MGWHSYRLDWQAACQGLFESVPSFLSDLVFLQLIRPGPLDDHCLTLFALVLEVRTLLQLVGGANMLPLVYPRMPPALNDASLWQTFMSLNIYIFTRGATADPPLFIIATGTIWYVVLTTFGIFLELTTIQHILSQH